MFPTKETIEMLRTEYPDGTRVRLVKMDDVQAPPIGTEGTVVGVDGIMVDDSLYDDALDAFDEYDIEYEEV